MEPQELLKKSGALPVVQVNKLNESDSILATILVEQNKNTARMEGKIDDIMKRQTEVISDVQEVKVLARNTNGRVNKHAKRIEELSTAERLRGIKEREVEYFKKGLIYIPSVLMATIKHPVVWAIIGAGGAWLAHHFKFIP